MSTEKVRLLHDFSDWVNTLTESEYVNLLLDNSVVRFRTAGTPDKPYLRLSNDTNITLWEKRVFQGLSRSSRDRWLDPNPIQTLQIKSFEVATIGDVFVIKANDGTKFTIHEKNDPDADMFNLRFRQTHSLYTPIPSLTREVLGVDHFDKNFTFSFLTNERRPPSMSYEADPIIGPFNYLCATLPMMMCERNLPAWGGLHTSEFRQTLTPSRFSETIEFLSIGRWPEVLAGFLKHSPQWKQYSCTESNNDSFFQHFLSRYGKNPYKSESEKCDAVRTLFNQMA